MGIEAGRSGKDQQAENCFQKALALEPELHSSPAKLAVLNNYAALLRKLNCK
jgi:hypothetical protein